MNLLKRRSRRRWHYALIITVATTLNLVRLLEAEPLQSANDRSRWTTVWSLVERGTYQIDEIRRRPGWDTIDLVKHEGHFYSSKPPVLSTVVAGLYWVVKHTLWWTLDAHLSATTRLLLVLINLLPSTIALVLLIRLIDAYAESDFTRYFLVVSAATATLLQPFLAVLNNHTPGAYFCVLTLYALVQILVEDRDSGWLYALAGFSAASTSCVELPAALFAVAVFVLLAHANPRQTTVWFVPAAIVPLAAFCATNYLATGGWKPFYLYYGTDKYEFFDDGVPSYWMFPRGIDRAQDGTLAYLLHCTIGHHGLLSLTPIYLLTLRGWLSPHTWTESPLRVIHVLGMLLTGAVFCFYLTKTENYNYGGVSVALRWMLWLTPFWLLAMIPGLDAWHPEIRGRALCSVLLAVSVFSAWFPFGGPWHHPWLYQLMTSAGWIKYEPTREERDQALGPRFHTWLKLAPSSSETVAAPVWIEFEGLNDQGEPERLRIEDVTGADIEHPDFGAADVLLIRLTTSRQDRSGAQQVMSARTVAVDRQAYRDALQSNQWMPLDPLIVWSDETSESGPAGAVRGLRGLPEPAKTPKEAPYQPRELRYVKQPLGGREEKFQCVLATGDVWQPAAGEVPPTVHRRALWLTDDVPFGVLAFETSIRDARSGETYTRQRMVAVDASTVVPFDPSRLRRNP
ncbi:MAG: hypothetical protein AB7I48_28485 [Planctomycetaceae bacterium]